MTLDTALFIAVLLLFVFIGMIKSRRVQSEEGYLFAERNCGFWGLACTLIMTELNTSTLLAFAGLGYIAGLRALFLPAVFLIGLLFYAFTVAKKYKELNASSITALFRKRYGKPFAQLASFFLLCSMMAFTATYIKSVTLIFAPAFPMWNEWVLSGYLVVLILIMMGRGGLVAIIRTDILSFLLVCLIFPLFLFYSKGDRPPFSAHSVAEVLPHRFILSLIMLTMFTYILAPWYGQKIFSARSKQVAFSAVIFASVSVFILYGVAVLATAHFKNSGVIPSSPDAALPTLLNYYFPPGLRGIAYGTLFMISATTLAGIWNAMSSLFIADFGRKSTHYKQGLLLTIMFACGSYLFGNTLVDQILDKLILANIPVAALSFALLAGFYWKKASTAGAVWSTLVGFSWGLFSYLYFGEQGLYTWHWMIWGIPLTFGSGILASLLKPSEVRFFEKNL